MKRIDLDELKKIEFEMLKYVKKVCKQKNLKYYLAGGTLLGAIRHKGFIPWDDDIDILMPRSDYNKFISIISEEENDKYKILTPNNEDYYYFFSKLVDNRTILNEKNVKPIKNLGIYIDIFPLDGLPNNLCDIEKHANLLIKKFKLYQNSKSDTYCISNSIVKKCAKALVKSPYHIICKIKNWKKRKKQILSLMEKYDFENSNKVAYILSAYGKREILDKTVFAESKTVVFEGEEFSAPANYNQYLSSLYGDYMKLPPEKDRKSHHLFNAYWKE